MPSRKTTSVQKASKVAGMKEYRVILLGNEYTGCSRDVWVRTFDKYGAALKFVKGSGYVNGGSIVLRWQVCYRIEKHERVAA